MSTQFNPTNQITFTATNQAPFTTTNQYTLTTSINKSNSTAGAVQVEANLLEQPSEYLQFWPKIASQGCKVWFSPWFDFDGKYKRL